MSKEEYIEKIKEYLMKKHHYTKEEADKLIKLYEDDIYELMEKGLSPSGAGTAIIMGY